MDVKAVIKPATYGIQATGEASDRGRRTGAEAKKNPKRPRQKTGTFEQANEQKIPSVLSVDCEPLRDCIDTQRVVTLLAKAPHFSSEHVRATFSSGQKRVLPSTDTKKINKVL